MWGGGLEEWGKFLYQHRGKVVAVAAVGVAIGVYFSFQNNSLLSTRQLEEEEVSLEETSSSSSRKQVKKPQSLAEQMRRVARIQDEFERTLQIFLPTLHIKVVSIVDVGSTILRIKELRRGKRPEEEAEGGAEEELWEEIKVSSFVMVFVAAYSLCILSVLLRIQLYMISSTQESGETVRAGGAAGLGASMIEGTYQHFFEQGIDRLFLLVQPIVREKLRDWRVKDRLQVHQTDLFKVLLEIRGSFEDESFPAHLKAILLRTSSSFLFILNTTYIFYWGS